MASTIRQSIYFAAIIHGIGKLFYLAKNNLTANTDYVSDHSRLLLDFLASRGDKKIQGILPKHNQLLWTYEFLQIPEIKVKLESLGFDLAEFRNESVVEDTLSNLSTLYHNPNTNHQALIKLAIIWASGPESLDLSSGNSVIKRTNSGSLLSIFSILDGKDKSDFYTPSKLQYLKSESILPQRSKTEDFGPILREFLSEIKALPEPIRGKEKYFTESFFYLLKKYTSSIPAGLHNSDLPGVSLFEYLKISSAIADCLYAYSEEKGFENTFRLNSKKELELKEENNMPLLLTCVDLSGIQSFIYNISGTKAAKSLKGRSFYLQLLIETIIDRIILDNDLTPSHIVYSSGGKAYFLMPNTDNAKQNFDSLRLEIIEKLRKEHGHQLYVCMDYVPFSYTNNHRVKYQHSDKVIQCDTVGDLWKILGEKTGMQKQRKFEHLFLDDFELFFRPQEVKISDKICAVTGVPLIGNEAKPVDKDDFEKTYVSEAVMRQIEIGGLLKDSDFLVTFSGQIKPDLKKIRGIEPLNLGIQKYLFDKYELENKEGNDFNLLGSGNYLKIQHINSTPVFTYHSKTNIDCSYGYFYYGGNKQARNDYSEKTFEELGGTGSFKRLGVLRMDVDSLGEIFIRKIPINNRTLSTYATLSSQLDLFFSGYLNTIREKYKDWVNILYSGGDDVFAIGRWDQIIDFACDIRSNFKNFVGEREDITLSAGIALIGVKYPIAKGAALAGESEEKSKSYKQDDSKKLKDAITFLDCTFSWTEFEEVKGYKSTFLKLMQEGSITSSLLQKIIDYHFQKKSNPKDLSFIWKALYFLKRYEAGLNKYPDAQKEIKNIQIKIIEKAAGTSILEKLALAAKWTELEIRTTKYK